MKIKQAIEMIWSLPLVYIVHAASVDRPKRRAITSTCRDREGQRVLDLGCGTGNSAPLFPRSRYTGIDINPDYIAAARRRFPGREFIAGGAEEVEWGRDFQIILLNSFLHHLPDPAAEEVLRRAAGALAPSGQAIIQEPLIPGEKEHYHRLLMRLDRGDYFRSLDGWLDLIRSGGLVPEVRGRYQLRLLGIRGYHMVSISACPGEAAG